MSALGHSRPSHFVPVLNNVRYASDSDHSRYESELTLWANNRHYLEIGMSGSAPPIRKCMISGALNRLTFGKHVPWW
jgi:hypothetical protein